MKNIFYLKLLYNILQKRCINIFYSTFIRKSINPTLVTDLKFKNWFKYFYKLKALAGVFTKNKTDYIAKFFQIVPNHNKVYKGRYSFHIFESYFGLGWPFLVLKDIITLPLK